MVSEPDVPVVQGSLIQADHNKITALSRRICQELFGQDWDDLLISDWPHIASYYVAKQLRKADPESDVAKVVVAAMYELMAPYSSYMQQLKAGFYGRQEQSQQEGEARGDGAPGDEEDRQR